MTTNPASQEDYDTFVAEMNKRANAGVYDHDQPLLELTRRADEGDLDAKAMLGTISYIEQGEMTRNTLEKQYPCTSPEADAEIVAPSQVGASRGVRPLPLGEAALRKSTIALRNMIDGRGRS